MYRTNLKKLTCYHLLGTAVLLVTSLPLVCSCDDKPDDKPLVSEIALDGKDYIAVAAGWSHSLALKSDGSIDGWGDNRWGMADPPRGNDFVAIAAGTYYGLALKSDGSIVGWGSGASGAKYPPDGNDFLAISASAGSEHALALKRDGSIVGWGSRGPRAWDYGQSRPPAGNDFIAIAAGYSHSLALKADGSIIGWGANEFGLTDPPSGKDYVAIAAGGSNSIALKSDGSIVAWGSKNYGQAQPPPGNDFIAVSAGDSHALALKSDGSIVGWGYNNDGQARPPAGNDFIAIAAALDYSLALRSDGTIVGWGDKFAMKKPILHRPKVKEKAETEPKQEVTEVVEVESASFLKSIEPLRKTIRLTVDGKTSIDLVYIRPGSFIMGRDVGWREKFISRIGAFAMVGKYPDNWPARKVKITKGFYIGKYKVTNTQFCKFLNTVDNPQDYVELDSNMSARIEIKDGAYVPKPDCENGAINVVHWKGAAAFCNWLSHQTGLTFRLPTEAEWEFAARGPEGRRYPWGDKKEENVVYYQDSTTEYKKYPHIWSCAEVDAFPENVTPDGVVGMTGYMGEWCSDFYLDHYLKDDVIDPQGPRAKHFLYKYHVFRGRLSFSGPREFGDTAGSGIYGFRIVVELPQKNLDWE